VKILVIGGTEFVGRAFVELAAAGGHVVTVFHRGTTEPADLPTVEHLHADRGGDLVELGDGEAWDAVLDTCGYVPRVVRASASRLAAARRYVFVSTLSVHPDDMPAGADEDTPIHPAPYPDTEEVTNETYGPLKVACELAVGEVFGARDRATIVRPGYIVGPHDPTERFVSWIRRATSGGRIAVPGPPDQPLQVVDVRDLGAFMLRLIESDVPGTFGAVGPGEPLTIGGLVETAVAVSGSSTEVVWLDPGAASSLGDEAERYRLFPMWHPESAGVHLYDAGRAVAAGLRHRPFEQTVRDTLAWDRARVSPQEPLPFGPRPQEERELLAKAAGSERRA
jgi:2'-hydroxyisoflavone reductase